MTSLFPRRRQGAETEPATAILIPCWSEEAVIERMLAENLRAIDYSNYEVWLGVYPNDEATQAKVAACCRRNPRIHYVVCPHDGPTTKADCLNWIYQGLVEHEKQSEQHYEIIVHHDAEDVVHPESLRRIARHIDRFEMIQIPVFPLPTGLLDATHGVYCDEFAESHVKDLRVRTALGGFLPSAGVGTAYRRDALEGLRATHRGRLFDPDSLTEDYTIGLELHCLGASQAFLRAGGPRSWIRRDRRGRPQAGVRWERIATRAYFPRRFTAAVRQRARWITGISLQTWEKAGWRAGRRQLYWLWRDRKGVIGYPASLLANALCLYGLLRWGWAEVTGGSWDSAGLLSDRPWLLWLLAGNLMLFCWRQAVRSVCAARIYGWSHGLTVPLRAPWANLMNCVATFRALGTFAAARSRGRPLSWNKTVHTYPPPGAFAAGQPRLGETLVSLRQVSASEIVQALNRRSWSERLGEYLVRTGRLSEEQLYAALSIQHGLPFRSIDFAEIEPFALTMLPRRAARALRTIPYRFDDTGGLWLASPELPPHPSRWAVCGLHERLVRFVLITPANYQGLRTEVARLRFEPQTLHASAGD